MPFWVTSSKWSQAVKTKTSNSHPCSYPGHRNPAVLCQNPCGSFVCNMKCCVLKWTYTNTPRPGACSAFRLSSPKPSRVTVTATGCANEWFLHRDPREAGVLLITQTHTLGSWATLFPTVPGTNHSLGPRRCLLRNERLARQGATQVRLFNMQQEKQDSLLFISNINTERKERKDFTFYTYFFERSPKYNIKGNIGSIVTSQ